MFDPRIITRRLEQLQRQIAALSGRLVSFPARFAAAGSSGGGGPQLGTVSGASGSLGDEASPSDWAYDLYSLSGALLDSSLDLEDARPIGPYLAAADDSWCLYTQDSDGYHLIKVFLEVPDTGACATPSTTVNCPLCGEEGTAAAQRFVTIAGSASADGTYTLTHFRLFGSPLTCEWYEEVTIDGDTYTVGYQLGGGAGGSRLYVLLTGGGTYLFDGFNLDVFTCDETRVHTDGDATATVEPHTP